ncbi:YcjF family protein [Reinekea blandensis]|uniref:G domain-containing protein n=1 Tax=Reinekea blandensis MED297 TaxID=314283 RepID=A4BFM6_9GAMM|nr:GTPase [Reinekea blandensis]EAR09121.1 hypothetical protein MED297_17303 [Reinekea sp. MED297] [Reinekea blandensis MED297]
MSSTDESDTDKPSSPSSSDGQPGMAARTRRLGSQLRKVTGRIVKPGRNPEIDQIKAIKPEFLPTLWLLGKTGAGKSSLIKAVTGIDRIEIGLGFRPCTDRSYHYDFPSDKPVCRFIDTRGLGEADYDATEDIDALSLNANAVVLVMKLDEPEQSAVLAALKQVRASKKVNQVLLVHTGKASLGSTEELASCRAYNQRQVESVWGKPVESVAVELDDEHSAAEDSDHRDLIAKLSEFLPIVAFLHSETTAADSEHKSFKVMQKELLWYATAAGSSDAFPAVGLVSVPVLQTKMLHSIAEHYGVPWGKKEMAELMATLGAGFGVQYSVKLGLRQLVKFIPVYGQTIGAASAAAISFSSTFALGRLGCLYMYHKSRNEPVSAEELKKAYQDAFASVRGVSGFDENHPDH